MIPVQIGSGRRPWRIGAPLPWIDTHPIQFEQRWSAQAEQAYLVESWEQGARFELGLDWPWKALRVGDRIVAVSLVGLVANAIVAGVAVLGIAGWQRARRIRRAARGLCFSCGYDLRGTTGQRCPECGTPMGIATCSVAPAAVPRACVATVVAGGVALSTTATALALGTMALTSTPPPSSAVIAPGNEIVAALERFREEAGEYPKHLSQLAPAYLNAVPKPEWGFRHWEYRSHGRSFSLVVRTGRPTYACWYYADGRWRLSE